MNKDVVYADLCLYDCWHVDLFLIFMTNGTFLHYHLLGCHWEVFNGFHTQIRFTSCFLSKFFGQSFIFVLQIINPPPWVYLQELDDPGLWGWFLRLDIRYTRRKHKSGLQNMIKSDASANTEMPSTDKTPERPKQYSHTIDLHQRSSVLVILIMLKHI